MEQRFQTINATATRFGIPCNTLRRLVKLGKVPCFFSGNRAYIDSCKLEESLANLISAKKE